MVRTFDKTLAYQRFRGIYVFFPSKRGGTELPMISLGAGFRVLFAGV